METILIIEDDAAMLRGLCANLRAEGFVVRSAADGESGLQQVLEAPPDLILLDIMLPKVNGYEVCRIVRERQLEMPIIMLTAKGEETDIVLGLNLGADDYVTKPFSIRELLARIRAFLRRGRREKQAEYRFGAYLLDMAACRLSREGREITLTPKEFRLLTLFAGREGKALTRDEILNRVWGHNCFAGHRSVDRCIATLRTKIESDPHHPEFIHTLRDIGYKFEPPPS